MQRCARSMEDLRLDSGNEDAPIIEELPPLRRAATISSPLIMDLRACSAVSPRTIVRLCSTHDELYWLSITQMKYFLDLFIALSYVYNWRISRGVISAIGLISGIISVHRCWVFGS